MNPKDKAQHLIKLFKPFTYTAVHAHKTSGEDTDAIECALKFVGEIMYDYRAFGLGGEHEDSRINYWEKVRQELNKL